MLLRPLGRYGLHASGVARDSQGVLIVGGAGQGKTTLALGLVEAGWYYLSDDALVLHPRSGRVEALALRRGFSCTPQTIERFPGLIPSADERPGFEGGKQFVEIDRQLPGSFKARCVPNLLIFPQISDAAHSELQPLDGVQVLKALVQQSPGILTGDSLVEAQLQALAQLVRQARSFRLLLGSDIYQDPAAVAAPLLNLS